MFTTSVISSSPLKDPGKSKPKDDDDEAWYCIDAHIKSWFFSTCKPSLLQIISSDGCTTKDLWDNLEEFFLNNKMSRMLQIQYRFRNTKKVSLSITEYCHTLKNLVDDLKDVDGKVTNVKLAMQIFQQLPPSYQSIVDVITHKSPFPSFLEAKNMLLLHESREANVEATIEAPLAPSQALYSSSNTSGKHKMNWSKNPNNGKTTSKNGGTSNNTQAPNNFAGILGNAQTYYGNMLAQTGIYQVAPQQQQPAPSPLQQPSVSPSLLSSALQQPGFAYLVGYSPVGFAPARYGPAGMLPAGYAAPYQTQQPSVFAQ